MITLTTNYISNGIVNKLRNLFHTTFMPGNTNKSNDTLLSKNS